MKQSKTITKIAPALLAAQKKIGAAEKKGVNPFFHSSYAQLGSVMEACKDALNDNEITVLQPVMNDVVETVLLHISGEWISSESPIVTKRTKTDKYNKDGDLIETVEVLADPQSTGSAISYARRYGLQSMVFIPAEDDDANKASAKEVSVTKGVVKNGKYVREQEPKQWTSREPAATQKQVNYLKKLMEELELPVADDKTIFGWGIKKVSDLISQYKEEIAQIAINGKEEDGRIKRDTETMEKMADEKGLPFVGKDDVPDEEYEKGDEDYVY
jgi:hypothetical protein